MPNYLKKSQITELNLQPQHYRNFVVTLMGLGSITDKAARFRLFGTRQNIWIPTKHLDKSFSIKAGENLDYVFSSREVANKLAIIIRDGLLKEELRQPSNKKEPCPCPLCGSIPVAHSIPPHKHALATFMPDCKGEGFVECPSCSCSVAGGNIQEAVDKWNRRQ